jgi:hypothetical protein
MSDRQRIDIVDTSKTMNYLFRWYFALISISGLFSVTFSVVYSYVADVTDESSRGAAYGTSNSCSSVSIDNYDRHGSGLVTATFAASLITSPAIGAHLARLYSENFVIALGKSQISALMFVVSMTCQTLTKVLLWLFSTCCSSSLPCLNHCRNDYEPIRKSRGKRSIHLLFVPPSPIHTHTHTHT